VEDQELLRDLIREAIELNGYVVLEAANGLDALRINKAHPGPIHVLLTDVVMPHMSGRELARRLALERPNLRALYMSGYAGDKFLQPGVPFLQKPFDMDTLVSRIRDLLDAPSEGLSAKAGGGTGTAGVPR
jgi:CheY-like chemotaxis protein